MASDATVQDVLQAMGGAEMDWNADRVLDFLMHVHDAHTRRMEADRNASAECGRTVGLDPNCEECQKILGENSAVARVVGARNRNEVIAEYVESCRAKREGTRR